MPHPVPSWSSLRSESSVRTAIIQLNVSTPRSVPPFSSLRSVRSGPYLHYHDHYALVCTAVTSIKLHLAPSTQLIYIYLFSCKANIHMRNLSVQDQTSKFTSRISPSRSNSGYRLLFFLQLIMYGKFKAWSSSLVLCTFRIIKDLFSCRTRINGRIVHEGIYFTRPLLLGFINSSRYWLNPAYFTIRWWGHIQFITQMPFSKDNPSRKLVRNPIAKFCNCTGFLLLRSTTSNLNYAVKNHNNIQYLLSQLHTIC